MSRRRKWIMGNWKMNGDFAKAVEFFEAFLARPTLSAVDVSLGIPSLYLKSVADLFGVRLKNSSIFLGAQDVSEHSSGAYTGEVSAAMLAEIGAKTVIVGHSERRHYQGETDVIVGKKARAAFDSGLVPVVCLGETLEARQAGKTQEVIQNQLKTILNVAGIEIFEKAVIAYEPVWAIGTGLAATSEQIQEVHAFLRDQMKQAGGGIADKTRIVYGGSLKFSNAQAILALEDVDGGLIGGASLNLDEFLSIIQVAVF